MPIKDVRGDHPGKVLKDVTHEPDIDLWIRADDARGQWEAFKLIECFNRLTGLPSLESAASPVTRERLDRDRRRFG